MYMSYPHGLEVQKSKWKNGILWAMLEVRKSVWSLVRVCEPNVLLSHDTTKCGIRDRREEREERYLINNILKME